MRGTVLTYAAQEIPQIDPPEAEKRAIYGLKLGKTAPPWAKVSILTSKDYSLRLIHIAASLRRRAATSAGLEITF